MRIRAVLVAGLLVLAGCGGGSEGFDGAPAPKKRERGPAENVAAIAVGPGYDDADVAAGQALLDTMMRYCPELPSQVKASDLFAGIYTAIEDRNGSVSGPTIMREYQVALSADTGMSCQDVAVAYIGTVTG